MIEKSEAGDLFNGRRGHVIQMYKPSLIKRYIINLPSFPGIAASNVRQSLVLPHLTACAGTEQEMNSILRFSSIKLLEPQNKRHF